MSSDYRDWPHLQAPQPARREDDETIAVTPSAMSVQTQKRTPLELPIPPPLVPRGRNLFPNVLLKRSDARSGCPDGIVKGLGPSACRRRILNTGRLSGTDQGFYVRDRGAAARNVGLWRSASSSEGFRTHGWNDRPFSNLRRLQRGSDSALCCEPRGELRI